MSLPYSSCKQTRQECIDNFPANTQLYNLCTTKADWFCAGFPPIKNIKPVSNDTMYVENFSNYINSPKTNFKKIAIIVAIIVLIYFLTKKIDKISF